MVRAVLAGLICVAATALLVHILSGKDQEGKLEAGVRAGVDSTEQSDPRSTEAPPTPLSTRAGGTRLTRGEALGQLVVGRFAGSTPSPDLLARIEQGQLGGVILFSENVPGPLSSVEHLTDKLQSAARRGKQPPLLIFVDQEGGEIRRLPGPPALPPNELSSTEAAGDAGGQAGRYLRKLGINFNLAPVADVPVKGSFIEDRSFSGSSAEVAARACAFAAGQRAAGVGSTLKHFPGLGAAGNSTDEGSVRIGATPEHLRAEYGAYESCATDPLMLVMVSSAAYPKVTGEMPAVVSKKTYSDELRRAGAAGVPTISDDLQTPALGTVASPAATALRAGLDMLLYAKTEAASADAFGVLLGERGRSGVRSALLRSAAAEVLSLKAAVEPELMRSYLQAR